MQQPAAVAGQESGVDRMERESREKSRVEAEARRAAGLSFWRLVWIVALGILVAQAIGAIIIAIFRAIAR